MMHSETRPDGKAFTPGCLIIQAGTFICMAVAAGGFFLLVATSGSRAFTLAAVFALVGLCGSCFVAALLVVRYRILHRKRRARAALVIVQLLVFLPSLTFTAILFISGFGQISLAQTQGPTQGPIAESAGVFLLLIPSLLIISSASIHIDTLIRKKG